MKKCVFFFLLSSICIYTNAQDDISPDTDIETETTAAPVQVAPEAVAEPDTPENTDITTDETVTPARPPIILKAKRVTPDAKEDGSGWYIGGTIGVAHVIVDVKGTPYIRPTEKSRSEVGVAELYGGHSFDKNFAIDFSLKAYGDVADDDDDIFEASLLTFSAMPKFTGHFGKRFQLFGKAGFALVAYSEYYEEEPSSSDESESWSGIGVTASGGFQIALPKDVHIKLVYEYLEAKVETGDDNEYDTGTIDIELRDREIKSHRISLGAHYQF